MSAPADLDAMIASGEFETDSERRRHARLRLLWREADAAIRTDVSYSIALAEEANKAKASEKDRDARRERARHASLRAVEARAARKTAAAL
ncbi:hypothetical protein [Microbacterium sp. EST19A]|uniref:hypothetical protein n=1 Tax=Microbacterium sp. EST19A TaxID=2862681 RepID=UPI001CBF7AA0|nr:hypothetical protein [Microbacterium sp. EST19A]